MKTAIVMEGGAMRGMFTCGVIDVLMENGIDFDAAAGVSAGAVFGCNYKSRQIGRPIRYNKEYCRDWRYASIRSLILTGDLYGKDFCYRELPDVLDVFDRDAFRDNPMEFWLAATDIETGEAVYHCCRDGGSEDMEWMRASASIPLVSRPVVIGGRQYLDGGLAMPVPYRFMRENRHCDRIVTVLTRPAGYRKKPMRFLPAIRFMLRKYPNLAGVLANRHLRYNALYDDLLAREAADETIVIRPPVPLNVGGVEKDPEKLERVYQLGRREALQQLDAVRDYLGIRSQ